jgi:cell wall-associated NlpC family hydrolase
MLDVLLEQSDGSWWHWLSGVLLGGVCLLGLLVLLPFALLTALPSARSLAPTLPLPAQGEAPGRPVAASALPLPDASPSSAVAVARRYLGVPYVFGGTNPAVGLDCSGLVQLVFRELGMALPRTAQQQYDATVPVPQDQLQPGDLVFFARTYPDPHDWITHVGIYAGGGQQINAPTTGQVVSIQPAFAGFWGAHFAGGRRVRHG